MHSLLWKSRAEAKVSLEKIKTKKRNTITQTLCGLNCFRVRFSFYGALLRINVFKTPLFGCLSVWASKVKIQ